MPRGHSLSFQAVLAPAPIRAWIYSRAIPLGPDPGIKGRGAAPNTPKLDCGLALRLCARPVTRSPTSPPHQRLNLGSADSPPRPEALTPALAPALAPALGQSRES